MSHPDDTGQASPAELITRLTEQTSRLVRDELKLAQAEMAAKAKRGGMGAGLLAAAGGVAVFGLAAGIATAIIALALVVPAWLAALAVTLLLFVVAGIMALVGKKTFDKLSFVPEQTIENLQEDLAEVGRRSHHDHA